MKKTLPISLIFFIFSCTPQDSINPDLEIEPEKGCFPSASKKSFICLEKLDQSDENFEKYITLKCLSDKKDMHLIYGIDDLWEYKLEQGYPMEEHMEVSTSIKLDTPMFLKINLFSTPIRDNDYLGEKVGKLITLIPKIIQDEDNDKKNRWYLSKDTQKLRCSLPECKNYIVEDTFFTTTISRESLDYKKISNPIFKDDFTTGEFYKCSLIENDGLEEEIIGTSTYLFQQIEDQMNYIRKQIQDTEKNLKKQKKDIDEKSKI